jgi:hypothetical protein
VKRSEVKNGKNEVIFWDFQLPEFPKTIPGKITRFWYTVLGR